MNALFEALSQLTYSSQSAILMLGSFLWGIASVLLSPCHLTGIPLMLGYMTVRGTNTARETLIMSTLFSVGIFISILIIGLITGLLGMMLGNLGLFGEFFLIAVLVYFGLATLGVVPFVPGFTLKSHKKGFWGIFVAGLLFGTGLGPCTFSFMAPVLGMFLEKLSTDIAIAASIVLAFGLGHCVVIIVVGTSFERFSTLGRHGNLGKWFRYVSGSILILYGLYRLYDLLKNIVFGG